MKKLGFAICVLLLSGCGGVKEELGVGRHSPDEFTVVKRAPLTLPPDYTLRPPSEAAAAAVPDVPRDTARASVMGAPAPAPAAAADGALMDKLGAGNADAGIRSKIDADNGYLALQNRPVAEKLIFWENGETGAGAENVPAMVVDPQKEAERIKKNQAEGKPLSEGDVPVITKKPTAFDKLF